MAEQNPLVGAVIEIIEQRSTPPDPTGIGDQVIAPNEIRINGQRLLVSDADPVIMHENRISANDLVRVTLTLLAKRVVIGIEHPEEADRG